MQATKATLTAGIITVTLFSGCSSYWGQQSTSNYPSSYPTATRSIGGTIESIQLVRTENGTSGAGALVGGAVGGLLGNQVGSGSGQTAATVAGAVGGALIGNEIERNRDYPREAYQLNIRLDDGTYRTVTQENIADVRVGSRVRVENARVYPY